MQRDTLTARFMAAAGHSLLKQLPVAREAVRVLCDHPERIPVSAMGRAATAVLGGTPTIEQRELLERVLEDDGWIARDDRPAWGKGLAAVYAYRPTARWRTLKAEWGERRKTER